MFIDRFWERLITEKFDGPIWERFLLSYTGKWKVKKRLQYHDSFDEMLELGFVKYGGNRRGFNAIYCNVDKSIFDKYISLGQGQLTDEIIKKAKNCAYSQRKVTLNPIRKPIDKSIWSILDEYQEQRELLANSPTKDSVMNFLHYIDKCIEELRAVIVSISHTHPTEEALDKNRQENSDW